MFVVNRKEPDQELEANPQFLLRLLGSWLRLRNSAHCSRVSRLNGKKEVSPLRSLATSVTGTFISVQRKLNCPGHTV